MLGVKIKDANGNLRPANDIFLETATKLQSIEDQTLRSKMAFDIFGRSAGPLLQSLGQTEGLEKFVEFSEKFGVRTGPKASDAAADFQVVIAALDTTLKGMKSIFIEVFGPSISKLIIEFGSNLAFLQSLMITFSDTISTAFTKALELVTSVFNALLKLLPEFIFGIVSALPVIGKFARIIFELVKPLLELLDFEGALGGFFVKFENGIKKARAEANQFKTTLEGLIAGGFKGFGGGGGGGGGGGEGTPTTTGADFGGFVSALGSEIAELSNVGIRTNDHIDELLTSLAGLPELLEKALRVSIAGTITDAIVAGVSGPAGFLNALGEALSDVTMGLSKVITDAITGITRLGEKSPKEIRQDFMNFARAFEKGLQMLPRVLIQVLPRFALAIIEGFLKTIIKLPAIIADAFGEEFVRIWESVKEFFKSIFTREGRQERRQERRNRRRSRERFFENLGESSQFYMSGGIMQAQSGARFTGRSRGLAMLHEGETVLPASGRAGQAEQRAMVAGSIS
jgi:hypothetical protein